MKKLVKAVAIAIFIFVFALIAFISAQHQAPCEKLQGKEKQACVKKMNSEKPDSADPLSSASPAIMRFD